MSAFKKAVYSKSEEDFNLKSRAFINEAYGVYVNPPGNTGPVSLAGYYQRRWEACKEMWAAHCRSNLLTLADNMNNR